MIRLSQSPDTRRGSAMPNDDAVTLWFDQLQAGKSAAARPLWEKYFHRLIGLARTHLRDAPRVTDSEDVALSAFDSFCRNAEAGRFPDLSDRESLWRLLAAFTRRKVAHHLRDAGRLKRGGGVAGAGSEVLEEMLGREPDPALAAEVAEECERLLAVLKDAELRRIALLRMDGHSVDEVAAQVGCAPRSVKRKLRLIRSIWTGETRDEPQ
jgi:DNA-directed RNA polymerase specialized sigma24 family protein